MSNPKISVIVPVYNAEKYILECLDSIVNQTLKDIEIICVNDGSTDGSAALLDEYAHKDKRIRILHKDNVLMELTLHAVDYEQADKIRNSFNDNTAKIYGQIISMLY